MNAGGNTASTRIDHMRPSANAAHFTASFSVMRRALPQVAGERRDVDRLSMRLRQALARALDQRARRLAALGTALGHLDPTRVLARGYSIVRDAQGHVVLSAKRVAPGDALDIAFSEGGAGVTVRETR